MPDRILRKITTGYVVQTYCGEQCVSQEFIAGDEVDWENDLGEAVDEEDQPCEIYQSFDMVQPDIGDMRWAEGDEVEVPEPSLESDGWTNGFIGEIEKLDKDDPIRGMARVIDQDDNAYDVEIYRLKIVS